MNRKNPKRGFTILEAMIAVTILSVGILALIRVMPVGSKGSKISEQITVASMLAQAKIEELRKDSLSNWPPPDSAGNFTDQEYPDYEYKIDLFDYPYDGTIPYLQGVTISVYWPRGKPTDQQRCLAVTTCIAQY